jgi:hypothetical protein
MPLSESDLPLGGRGVTLVRALILARLSRSIRSPRRATRTGHSHLCPAACNSLSRAETSSRAATAAVITLSAWLSPAR